MSPIARQQRFAQFLCRSGLLLIAGVLAFPPSHAADLARGLRAYETGDYAAARAELLPLAEGGDSEAQLAAGVMYSKGLGVPQDYFEAANWFGKLAKKRDPRGEYSLGLLYRQGLGVP
jgi:TPR repeat protein